MHPPAFKLWWKEIMKKINLKNKLNLSKETITKLNHEQIDSIIGGKPTSCTFPPKSCNGGGQETQGCPNTTVYFTVYGSMCNTCQC